MPRMCLDVMVKSGKQASVPRCDCCGRGPATCVAPRPIARLLHGRPPRNLRLKSRGIRAFVDEQAEVEHRFHRLPDVGKRPL